MGGNLEQINITSRWVVSFMKAGNPLHVPLRGEMCGWRRTSWLIMICVAGDKLAG
jgi:hypothetical protein